MMTKQTSPDSEYGCPNCNEVFGSQRGMRIHHTTKHPDSESLTQTVVECDSCGSDIKKRKSQVYERNFCNEGCQSEWQSNNRSGEDNPRYNRVNVECDWCSSELLRIESRVKGRNFCDKNCQGEWKSKNLVGEESPTWKDNEVEVECDNCGEVLTRPQSRVEDNNRNFCDTGCNGEWESRNLVGEEHPSWKGGDVDLICNECGEYYKLPPSQARGSKCCSVECRREWHSKYMAGDGSPLRKRVNVRCNWCDKELSRTPSNASGKNFCKPEHHDEWRSENQTGENHHQYTSVNIDCFNCGESVTRKPSQIYEKTFCGDDCHAEWMSKHNTGINNPLWSGGESFKLSVQKAISENGWEYTRSVVREKSDYECEMCGKDESNCFRELSVHHIVPLLSGGCNSTNLLMALCPACHQKAESVCSKISDSIIPESSLTT